MNPYDPNQPQSPQGATSQTDYLNQIAATARPKNTLLDTLLSGRNKWFALGGLVALIIIVIVLVSSLNTAPKGPSYLTLSAEYTNALKIIDSTDSLFSSSSSLSQINGEAALILATQSNTYAAKVGKEKLDKTDAATIETASTINDKISKASSAGNLESVYSKELSAQLDILIRDLTSLANNKNTAKNDRTTLIQYLTELETLKNNLN
jgi:hypothetical protein